MFGMTLTELIVSIIIGAIAGWIANKIMGSKGGLLRNIIIGVIGRFLGPVILGVFGISGSGMIGTTLVSVVGACALIFIGKFLFR